MNFYRKHIFFCINQSDSGKKCCADANAESMRSYAKSKIKKLGLDGEGGVRVNAAGCLGRCQQGPAVVIYPEGVWYTYKTVADIDEIIALHIVQDKIVTRLLLDPVDQS
jgi:(2Fe-2S) ferredoxin